MTRMVSMLPAAATMVFLTLGSIWGFPVGAMRITVLVLILALAPAALYLRRQGRASAIDLALTGYIFLAGAGFWLWPGGLGAALAAQPAAILYAVLFLTAALPPLLGREPFTMHFARRTTPPEVWDADIFKRINAVMTRVWAGLFAVAAVSALLPGLVPALAGTTGVVVFHVVLPLALMLGVGVTFNKKYPAYYQRKLGLAPDDQGRVPASARDANSCRELLRGMPLGFNPEQAGDLEAVIQFEISGEDFTAHLAIAGGACTHHQGPAENPDLTIKAPGEVWLAIAKGEKDGQAAFMAGEYQARGRMAVLMQMNRLFS